ncbi:ABC transporter ATP-binding protein [Sneathiella chinensis]|uniref:ABC transporter ATP-binding protein n=1 Tax=Sneathiella chinensis TaxID=349750 RepID=A0ABQ5TZ28_9PROT|nr:ABC transporter ATP-binding protein [Sneathiella chinensis]GLQ05134.1 ABC transporter ATP-binding protein [Sneathiella chinensis]
MTDTHTSSSDVLLEIRGLNKSFGGVKAVDEVSMDLRAGIVTTLVGPNGAGKTTFFNLITGELTKDTGSIRWLGQKIDRIKPYQAARKGILRTFQDLRLFNDMTVEENILTSIEPMSFPTFRTRAQRAEQQERVEYALERTGLADKRHTLANDLAYAERKFLSMARILATDARLWLLDEPASGLDPQSYDRFLDILRVEVKKGVTVCIIEHNLDIVISISDRIAFLDRGRLLADGDPETVLNDPELTAIYFGERA